MIDKNKRYVMDNREIRCAGCNKSIFPFAKAISNKINIHITIEEFQTIMREEFDNKGWTHSRVYGIDYCQDCSNIKDILE
jgi:hypothetical protein